MEKEIFTTGGYLFIIMKQVVLLVKIFQKKNWRKKTSLRNQVIKFHAKYNICLNRSSASSEDKISITI